MNRVFRLLSAVRRQMIKYLGQLDANKPLTLPEYTLFAVLGSVQPIRVSCRPGQMRDRADGLKFQNNLQWQCTPVVGGDTKTGRVDAEWSDIKQDCHLVARLSLNTDVFRPGRWTFTLLYEGSPIHGSGQLDVVIETGETICCCLGC